jgi:hypothetical protein
MAELTPYTGKHSAPPKKGPGPEKGQIDAYTARDPAPASKLGGSMARKGKAEVTPYGGAK